MESILARLTSGFMRTGLYALIVVAFAAGSAQANNRGSSFGVDFNPTVDRLRIISDSGQNLRANVDTGATIIDGAINFTPGTPTTGVTAAAYTNSV